MGEVPGFVDVVDDVEAADETGESTREGEDRRGDRDAEHAGSTLLEEPVDRSCERLGLVGEDPLDELDGGGSQLRRQVVAEQRDRGQSGEQCRGQAEEQPEGHAGSDVEQVVLSDLLDQVAHRVSHRSRVCLIARLDGSQVSVCNQTRRRVVVLIEGSGDRHRTM